MTTRRARSSMSSSRLSCPRSGIPRRTRRINTDVTLAFIKAVGLSPEGDRVFRAIGQYHMALMHWRLGEESLAMAHLYMGMEALVKAAIRTRCREDGMTEQ